MWMKAGIAPQVQQRVQLDGCLGGAKRRPLEQGQTQIDGAGVQRVDGVVQANVQRIACVKFARTASQHGGQVRPDTPVARFVGIGQRGALDRRTKAHRVQLARVGRQTRLDVAQTLAPGQLCEGHGPELLGTRQGTHARVAAVALHDAREARPGNELHDLGEQVLPTFTAAPRGCQSRETTYNLIARIQIGTKLNWPQTRANACSRACHGGFNRTAVSVHNEDGNAANCPDPLL